MEKLKTAAILFSIVLIGFIFYSIWSKQPKTLSFKGCEVAYRLKDDGLNEDDYRAAQNRLALCLCGKYLLKKDTAVGNRIMQIYLRYKNLSTDSFSIYNSVDSIVKYRYHHVLDTLVLRD